MRRIYELHLTERTVQLFFYLWTRLLCALERRKCRPTHICRRSISFISCPRSKVPRIQSVGTYTHTYNRY